MNYTEHKETFAEIMEHPMFMASVTRQAFIVAMVQHEGQKRKYNEMPYVFHPFEVAKILYENVPWVTPNMLAAAILHDTVEDTDYTFKEMNKTFGKDVTKMVYYVTDISQPEDGNRAVRKLKDAEHYANGTRESQTIKVADLIDNTGGSSGIKYHDADFWKVYRREKERLLNMFDLADEGLKSIAWGYMMP